MNILGYNQANDNYLNSVGNAFSYVKEKVVSTLFSRDVEGALKLSARGVSHFINNYIGTVIIASFVLLTVVLFKHIFSLMKENEKIRQESNKQINYLNLKKNEDKERLKIANQNVASLGRGLDQMTKRNQALAEQVKRLEVENNNLKNENGNKSSGKEDVKIEQSKKQNISQSRNSDIIVAKTKYPNRVVFQYGRNRRNKRNIQDVFGGTRFPALSVEKTVLIDPELCSKACSFALAGVIEWFKSNLVTDKENQFVLDLREFKLIENSQKFSQFMGCLEQINNLLSSGSSLSILLSKISFNVCFSKLNRLRDIYIKEVIGCEVDFTNCESLSYCKIGRLSWVPEHLVGTVESKSLKKVIPKVVFDNTTNLRAVRIKTWEGVVSVGNAVIETLNFRYKSEDDAKLEGDDSKWVTEIDERKPNGTVLLIK